METLSIVRGLTLTRSGRGEPESFWKRWFFYTHQKGNRRSTTASEFESRRGACAYSEGLQTVCKRCHTSW